MNDLLVLIPFLIAVLLIVGAFLGYQWQLEKKRSKAVDVLETRKLITPVRLQAYERIVLLLERSTPGALLMRNVEPGLNARQLQARLLHDIRSEFDHNLSQQVYVSTPVWDKVKNAREQLVSLINESADATGEGTAEDLSSMILVRYGQENDMLSQAIEAVKSEARAQF